jgi:zinc protease
MSSLTTNLSPRKALGLWLLIGGVALGAAAQQPTVPPNAQKEKEPVPAEPAVKLVPKMPPPAAPRPFQFPTPVTKTLPNGLQVFVISAHAMGTDRSVQPAVAVELLIRDAGTTHDPGDKPGVASLAADLLDQGTDKRSAQQIAEAIDFVGGSLNADAGRDATTIRTTVVKKDFNLAMDLLSDVVLRPKFDAEEIERQREQLLSNLRVQYSDGNYLASAVFRRVVFGASPYAQPPDGTPASVMEIGREDMMAFHKQFFVPGQALLGFAGDITPDEAFAAAEKYFGAWSADSRTASTVSAPASSSSASGMRIVLVDKPDAVQTQIRIGRIGIPRNHPDYVPLLVANQNFGGSYNSRLNTQVRLKSGLSYDASSTFTSFLRSGNFQASTFTRSEQTVPATKMVIDEIARMATTEPTEEELTVARDYLAGVFTISSETPDRVADRVITAAFYGLPQDYNRTYPDKVRAVTREQVRDMAARYFNAKDLELVLVGNASVFRDALKQAFPAANLTEIPVAQLDLLSPGLRRGAVAPSPAARP